MKTVLLPVILFLSLNSVAETRFSTEDYIKTWKVTAIEQMNQYKIPASITLAQGILESGNGNSRLAKEAKNHFGIKCHTWDGGTFFQDDDIKNECFRAYNSASESYRDHSLFLQKKRYAGLFNLKISDYKGWAKGLKSAGYATNPKYAHLLINLVERYQLDKYDRMPNLPQQIEEEQIVTVSKPEIAKPDIIIKPSTQESSEITYELTETNHVEKTNKNGVSFIKAKKGDTFYRISKEYNMALGQLYKYNEFSKKDVLKEGDVIYIAPKKGRAKKNNGIYVCKTSVSLRDIAHFEGIRLNKLMKYNLMENPDKKLPKGTKVILR